MHVSILTVILSITISKAFIYLICATFIYLFVMLIVSLIVVLEQSVVCKNDTLWSAGLS